jgi:O-antigen/teichoic acid export membrane protein
MNELKQAAARGVAWNLVQNLAGRLLSLVVVGILARYLDRAAFGAVALALVVTSFAELLVSQGFSEFIPQREDLSDVQIATAFWLNIGTGALLTAGIAVAAEPIASGLGEASIAPIVRWLSLSLLLRSLSMVPTGLLVRRMQFRTISLRGVVAAAIGGVAGIIAALCNLGIYSLVVQVLVGDAVATLILWGATEWRPSFRFSSQAVRELTAFGAPVFAATLLNFGSRRLDTVIIAASWNIATLGTYYMAQRVFQIAGQVLNKSGDAVALSALSRVSAADRRREAFYQAIEITAALCFPLYGLLALLSTPVVVTLFGARWTDSAPILCAFAIAGLPISLSYLHAAALKSVSRTRSYLVVHIVLVSVYLPLLFVMVPHGPTAAGIAYALGCLVIMPVEIALVRDAIEIRVFTYLRWLAGPTVATAVMAAVTLGLLEVAPAMPAVIAMTGLGLLGLVTYVAALRLLAPGTYGRCRDLVVVTLGKRKRPS